MKRKYVASLLVLVITVILNGCGSWDFDNMLGSDDGDDGGNAPSNGSLTGAYQWVETQYGTGDTDTPPASREEANANHRERFTLQDDGDYTRQGYNDQDQTLYDETGTWRSQNGMLMLTSGDLTNTWEYRRDGGRLTLTRSANDGEFSYWTRVIYQK